MDANNNNKCDHNMCGGMGKCGCGNWHHQYNMYHVLRWLFAIAILVIVFSVGVSIGRLSGALENGGYGSYGYGHMRYYNNYGAEPMMYGGQNGTIMMRSGYATPAVYEGTAVDQSAQIKK